MESNNTYKIVLYALLGLAWLTVFLLSRDKLRNGFLLFICTLGLGYRTYPVTERLRILPAELVVCLLVLLAASLKTRPRQARRSLPLWLWLLMPFWGLAWLTFGDDGNTWDVRLAEFRNFVLIVPVFLVTPVVLSRAGNWRAVVLTLLGVSTWLAGMGILEHFVPGIAHALPGFMGNSDPLVAGNFQRASFSFYGSPIAVFICVMVLPFSLVAWRWWPASWQRALTSAGAALQLEAIYISGYRSMWLLVALQMGLLIVVQKRYLLGGVLICLALGAYESLPAVTRERIESLGHILEGRPDEIDTSGQKRWTRAVDALNSAFTDPAGRGWASSGWVHSDFIQVAANQGLLAGVLFLGAYLASLGRLGWRNSAAPELGPLRLPLLLSFSAVGGILLYEGVQFLPQTVLPVWLVWALVETWLSQTALAPKPQARRSAISANLRSVSRRPKSLIRLATLRRSVVTCDAS
jgi:hypothetical protein